MYTIHMLTLICLHIFIGQKSKMRANDDGGNGSTTGKIKPNAHLLTAIDNKTEVEPATIKAKSDLTTTVNAKAKPETTSNDETMKAESNSEYTFLLLHVHIVLWDNCRY